MPTYRYECDRCHTIFDEFRTMKSGKWTLSDLKGEPPDFAICHKCGHDKCERNYQGTRLEFSGTKVQDAEYNPGLGKVVKNRRHKQYLMESKGVVEIGNDFGSGVKQQEHYERRKQEDWDKSWEKV